MEDFNRFVSVLMPVYNGEKYLREAIESILNQTYSNFEFIIINDGSTDLSEEVITAYSDERIIYIRNETNLRLIATLNKGLTIAKGKYIVRMDQDDISLPNRLSVQVAFMSQHTEYVMAGSYVNTIDSNGNISDSITYYTEDEDLRFALTQYCPFIHPSVIIRRSVLQEHQLYYDESFLHAEDYRFWTKLSMFGKVKNIPDYLLHYRLHEDQTSQIHHTFQIQQMQLIQDDYLNALFPISAKELIFFFFKPHNSIHTNLINFKELIKTIGCIYDLQSLGGAFQRFILKRWKEIVQEQRQHTINDFFRIVFFKVTWKRSWKWKEIISLILKIKLY